MKITIVSFYFFTFSLAAAAAEFDCHNVIMDIAMVIPTKGNVGNDNYAAMIRSVEHLIKQFSVLKGSSRIAIVQFANKAKVRFDLSDLSSPDKLQKVIQAMHNENEDLGKEMRIYNALQQVSKKVFKEGRDKRPGSLEVIILFTHKPANDDKIHVIEELEVRRHEWMHSKMQNNN